MKVIKGPRGCGKTYDLIVNHFLPSTSILLVHSNNEKQRLIDLYHMSESAQKRIFTYDERDKIQGLGREDIMIDNIDIFFKLYFRRNVSVVTFLG